MSKEEEVYQLSEVEFAILQERDRPKEDGNYFTTDELEVRLAKWLTITE